MAVRQAQVAKINRGAIPYTYGTSDQPHTRMGQNTSTVHNTLMHQALPLALQKSKSILMSLKCLTSLSTISTILRVRVFRVTLKIGDVTFDIHTYKIM